MGCLPRNGKVGGETDHGGGNGGRRAEEVCAFVCVCIMTFTPKCLVSLFYALTSVTLATLMPPPLTPAAVAVRFMIMSAVLTSPPGSRNT